MYRGFKHTEEFRGIPAHWDKSAVPELGFKVWSFFVFFSPSVLLCTGLLHHKFNVACAFVDDCFLRNILQRCW